jgi:ABC-type nitrate/sulfonate/bicarbonate transport system substrate-binding protein
MDLMGRLSCPAVPRPPRPKILAAASLLAALAMAMAMAMALLGCGTKVSGSSGPFPNEDATLMLDFTPNAVHAGIYSALNRGYDQGEGVTLHVQVPGATTDSIKLLEDQQVQFAILDIHDLAIADEHGANLVGIMAIVEQPLAAVIAQPAVKAPAQLEGKTVGITGVPSDTAVLDSIVAGAHADPKKVKTLVIGYNAVQDLLANRVDAATAFWNDEGVTLNQRRPGFNVFRVQDFGAPDYPELVLCATRSQLRSDPNLAHAVVRALVRGYGVTVTDPASSASDLEQRVAGLDPKLVSADMTALAQAFEAPNGAPGVLDKSALEAWANWELKFGIVKRKPDIEKLFDPEFVAGTEGLVGS